MKKQLPKISEQLTNNWVYKVVSLLVALSIWVTTYENKKEIMRSRSIQVEFVLGSKNTIEDLIDRSVFVKVVGPKLGVKRYIQSMHVISVDLTEASPGLKRVDIKPTDLSLPSGVRVIAIEPNYFDLDIKEVKK